MKPPTQPQTSINPSNVFVCLFFAEHPLKCLVCPSAALASHFIPYLQPSLSMLRYSKGFCATGQAVDVVVGTRAHPVRSGVRHSHYMLMQSCTYPCLCFHLIDVARQQQGGSKLSDRILPTSQRPSRAAGCYQIDELMVKLPGCHQPVHLRQPEQTPQHR